MEAAMRATLTDFVQSYNDANATKDGRQILRTLTADHTRRMAPASFLRALGIPVDTALTNDQIAAHFGGQLPVIADGRTELRGAPVVDATARRAALHIVNHIRLQGAEDVIVLENTWFLDFTEDGKHICRSWEMADSAEAKRYLGLVMQAQKAAAESKEAGSA